MGTIMDFEGQAVDSLSDAIKIVRDIVTTGDTDRARAFRDTWRAADPANADDNLVYAIGWGFRSDPEQSRNAIQLLGVTNTVYGAEAPSEVLRPAREDQVVVPANTLEEAIQTGVLDAANYASPESEPQA